MPTGTHKAILDRDLSKAIAAGLIGIASPLLQELVNHATNAMVRCDRSTTGGIDEDAAALTLYRHLIEMVDGIEVLVASCAPTPAIPLLRSAFESVLGLEYLFEEDARYAQRSLCWLVNHIHDRLVSYDRLDPDTPVGAKVAKVVGNDEPMSRITMPTPEVVRALRRGLAEMLSKPHMVPIEAEFQERRKHQAGRRHPQWYSLFDGPPNLRELAVHLKRGGQYEFLYRYWSKMIHGEDFGALVARDKTLNRLRNPTDLKGAASLAASFMLHGTQIMIDKFRHGENLAPWYSREIRERYLQLTRGEEAQPSQDGR